MTFNKYTALAALAASTNAINIASEAQQNIPVSPPGSFPVGIGNPPNLPPNVPIVDTNTLPAQLSITVSQLLRLQAQLDEVMRTVCPDWTNPANTCEVDTAEEALEIALDYW